MSDLDKLEELAKAATPGPWLVDHNGNPERYEEWYGATVLSAPTTIGEGVCSSRHLAQVDERPADASFIAAANPAAVLELIADHRATLARIAKVEALHARHPRWHDTCDHCGRYWPCPTVRALTEGENDAAL